MQINGTARIDRAQSIQRPQAINPSTATTTPTPVDQVDLSQEADLVEKVHELPDIRADRVAQIRAEIATGAYETEDKLDAALERLLDEYL